jgi:dTDP-4-amino-4,6-dideoxygalactose transaminase
MHLQPLYKGYEFIGGQVAEGIFKNGICLPSGTSMTEEDQGRVIGVVRGCFWKKGLRLKAVRLKV